MTKSETIQLITFMSGTYDNIANKSDKQKQIMITTWYECLKDLDYKLCESALKKYMITSTYSPTIADIRKNAIELIDTDKQKTAIEAWEEAYNMICNGLYMTQEQFDSASSGVKKFFGNIRQVSELSKTDIDTVNTVTKGQFLKQYEIITKRENENKLLPQDMRAYQLSNNAIKSIES